MHILAGTRLPRLPVKQSQGAPDDVAGLLVLTAVGLNDPEVLFGGAESDAHEATVQQTYNIWVVGARVVGGICVPGVVSMVLATRERAAGRERADLSGSGRPAQAGVRRHLVTATPP